MLRGLIDVGLPFLLPFAGYVLFLTLQSRYPFVAAAWTRGPVAALVVSGLALAVVALLLTGLFGPRAHGSYRPAHLENGVLVPGRLE